MSLPNPTMDAVPFTPLTAEFLDNMIENIESLSDGTGFDANAVPKGALEKAHYNTLLFSTSGITGGQVISNTEVRPIFDAYDTDNAFGITATTGANAYMTIARNGVYDLSATMVMSDGTASTSFILWFEVTRNAGTTWYRFRQQDRALAVGQGQVYSMKMPLLANDRVRITVYNGAGGIRLGNPNAGTILLDRMLTGPKFSVTEIR